MAIVNQNRSTRIDFTALDNNWTVNADISVAVRDDVAVASAIAGSRFTNNGVVFTAVSPSGGNGAVSFSGNAAVIDNNAGAEITGLDVGLTVNGAGAEIDNLGSITGARTFGVLFGAGSSNVTLENSGDVYGGLVGVQSLGAGGTIVNSGVIRSASFGISSNSASNSVTNLKDGVIHGAVKAIEINVGALSLNNLGTIVGLVDCFFMSGDDRIENRGAMGEVRLGAGDDVFVFAGGKQGLVTGGSDADQFVFSRKFAKKKDAATIADCTPIDDSIGLSKGLFKGIGKVGPLKEKFFASGKKAGDQNDRIIYDSDTGIGRYDKDGKGGTKAKIFAVLTGAPDVDAGDFIVLA
jgi:hypothetical protein